MTPTDSQKEAILAHLKEGGTITPMDALQAYGCFRLAARVKDLRDEGHRIDMTWEADGTKRWGRYSLSRKPAMVCAEDGQGMLL